MQAVQFFLFGLLIVWLVGTGKLAAFVDALRNAPSGGGGNDGGGSDTPAGTHPCSDDPSTLCVTDASGHELRILG